MRRLKHLIKTGENLGGIPRPMMRAAFYAPFAIRHHWTPEQVDAIPADILPYFLPVENVLREFMDEEAQKKAKSNG